MPKKTDKHSCKVDVPITPTEDAALDAARGLVSRAAYARAAIAEKIERERKGRRT